MSSDVLGISVLIIGGFTTLIWLVNRKLSSYHSREEGVLLEWLKATQSDIKELQTQLTQTVIKNDEHVTTTLQKSYQDLNARLEHTAKMMGELKTEAGKFSEIGRSMQALHDFLNSPKLRGNLGERVLIELIREVMPADSYSTQYRFQNGDTVDVVIKTQSGLIPVDSKFPMSNYTKSIRSTNISESDLSNKLFIQDIKKHVKAIADKYIKPDEKTIDFALMYVPSEAVYYEITANTPELDDYFRDYRVMAVSPSTFYAFLRTVLVSFEGQRIQGEAKRILDSLRTIQKESILFSEKLNVLQKHVSNAFNNMNLVAGDFQRLQTKIDATQALGTGSLREESQSLKP